MAEFKSAPKQAPPAYMVSFCDMMTLILTFFILLVSMSKEQQAGLVAKGVGSFIIAIQSHGLNGIMDGKDKREVFENMRRKFNLPPEEDPERQADNYVEASNMELIKTQLLNALEPHNELPFPQVASFDVDSAKLGKAASDFLRELAPSIQPKFAQVLLIEGHANDAGAAHGRNNQALAIARAQAVREFLVEELGFNPERVHARAWFRELEDAADSSRYVDIRLVTPASQTNR
jgi:chemotaxis protein MotB